MTTPKDNVRLTQSTIRDVVTDDDSSNRAVRVISEPTSSSKLNTEDLISVMVKIFNELRIMNAHLAIVTNCERTLNDID